MKTNNFNIRGLDTEAVKQSRKKYGTNTSHNKKENGFIDALKALVKEPMVILLLIAAVIYFVSGEFGDGIFLTVAIVLVSLISLFQDSRSRNALDKLKDLTQPNCNVIRENKVVSIRSEDLEVGDYMIVEEGAFITADGIIVHSNDFSVNESILTGESFVVYKDKDQDDHMIFQGTTVSSGLAVATVTAIGNQTKLGRIGKSLESIEEERTPLELQIAGFIKRMVIAGASVFMIVWAINYFKSYNVLDSLLKALTLAMSILPEEIPVAFTTFMALGAWRLMKLGVVVKQMKTVETLGSATVICTDKTGTITENKMSLARLYVLDTKSIWSPQTEMSVQEKELIALSMWASEPIPFDPMEIALHQAYSSSGVKDERSRFKLVHEYPLGGKPPMMTHIFEDSNGQRMTAAKGAPEALIKVSNLNPEEVLSIENALKSFANDGFRVLGVGETHFAGNDFPEEQQMFKFRFKGLVAFYDPPKKNIGSVLESFYNAGIKVKIITGDNGTTTAAIAKEIGFIGYDKSITGDELMKLNDVQLQETVMNTQIFTRMFPEAKLRIINALKNINEVVAMTGDGVNDGPALKAAHIGIAMGKKGTEIAKQAASLILVDDDLSKMVDAVAMGRKIYANLKKAIQYIISIHIPIILTVFVPLALGWVYPNIFSPVHIIFLELIMGPTCSIAYENEPMEKNMMLQKPRAFTTNFFNFRELATSILQGLVITVAILFTYQLAVSREYDESLTRTMVFTVLITANVFLTLVNRSFYYSILTTVRYKNNMVYYIIGMILCISVLIFLVPAVRSFFEFEVLSVYQMVTCIGMGFISVIWYEIIKWRKRIAS
jgi:Ca2+-transporting ATPase